MFALSAIFALLFIALYSTASAVSAQVPWSFSVIFPFEFDIPFMPGAAVLYVMITPLLCLAPFILRTLRQMLPLFFALCLQTVIGTALFVLIPMETQDPHLPCAGFFTCAFALADAMNLSGNNLPSLHVAFVVTAAIAYRPKLGRVGRLALSLSALCVAMSTVLTRQHRVIDVMGGVVLALATWRWAKALAAKEEIVSFVDVEILCWRNYACFCRRHVRYLTVIVALLLRSMGHYRERRVLRTGFCFLQAVDDVLDGDRASAEDPLLLSNRLILELESGRCGQSALSRLGRAFRTDILACGGERMLQNAILLIRNMQKDRRRAIAREVWTEQALLAHHRETFSLSVDLMLGGNGNSLRSDRVPEFIAALGWCSTVRDLKDDLERGLINLPREVIGELLASSMDIDAILDFGPVQCWLRDGALRAERDLELTDRRLQSTPDRGAAKVLRVFAKSIRRYARRSIVISPVRV